MPEETTTQSHAYGDRFAIASFDTEDPKTRASLSDEEIVTRILEDAEGKEVRTAVLISKDIAIPSVRCAGAQECGRGVNIGISI